MSNELAYIPDPRAVPPTWIGSRDLQGVLNRRTVNRAGVLVSAPTKIVDADINRMGVFITNTSLQHCYVNDTSSVGTTNPTGFPIAQGKTVWFPTSDELWANSGGCSLTIVEVFFL